LTAVNVTFNETPFIEAEQTFEDFCVCNCCKAEKENDEELHANLSPLVEYLYLRTILNKKQEIFGFLFIAKPLIDQLYGILLINLAI
jgi:hypothetical protein